MKEATLAVSDFHGSYAAEVTPNRDKQFITRQLSKSSDDVTYILSIFKDHKRRSVHHSSDRQDKKRAK